MFSRFCFENTFSIVSCMTFFILYLVIIDTEYNDLCKLENLYGRFS